MEFLQILQIIWFLLIGFLIIGYAILDGFDLGVGFWHLFAKKKGERTAFIHSIEPFWDGNEVWLLTGGGALFAAFPPVYASIFSGFYLAMMLVLLGLIFRAVSIEYREKVEDPRWVKAWDFAFSIGSILPSILYGVAIGNVIRGLELSPLGDYTGSFFDLLNPFSLLCGLVGLTMFAMHGALFLSMKVDGEIRQDARKWAAKMWYVFSVLFIIAAAWGSALYLRGGQTAPMVIVVMAIFELSIVRLNIKKGFDKKAFFASCITIALVMLAVAAALFPNLVPATNNPEWSLTIFNSSSSQLTLTTMLIITLIGMPLVLGYTFFIHRIFKGGVKVSDDH